MSWSPESTTASLRRSSGLVTSPDLASQMRSLASHLKTMASAARFSELMPSPFSARCSVLMPMSASAHSFSWVRFKPARRFTSTRPSICFSSIVNFIVKTGYQECRIWNTPLSRHRGISIGNCNSKWRFVRGERTGNGGGGPLWTQGLFRKTRRA